MKRAVAFFDVQNLFFATKEVFGAEKPDFDPRKLSKHFADLQGWNLVEVRYYTGVPDQNRRPEQHREWVSRLQGLRNSKVVVTTRTLHHRKKYTDLPLSPDRAKWVRFILPDGTQLPRDTQLMTDPEGHALPPGTYLEIEVTEEKGIDVCIAVDMIRLTNQKVFDVAILFSQDQDQAETVTEVRNIARAQNRQVEVVSVFPEGTKNPNYVRGTRPLRFGRDTYEACRHVIQARH